MTPEQINRRNRGVVSEEKMPEIEMQNEFALKTQNFDRIDFSVFKTIADVQTWLYSQKVSVHPASQEAILKLAFNYFYPGNGGTEQSQQ